MRGFRKFSRFGLMIAAAIPAAASVFWAPNAAAQDSASVTEIYVVAQRRSENLQDVPIAVSAVTAERISDLLSGGADVLALSARAPGLNIESSNGRVAPRFYIRGLGNTDFDLAASQPVSVVIDDVVMENVVLKSFPIFDVSQVEVLRGPQGTLYGRNTPAGIVHFRSVRPSEDFDAYGSLSYGSYGTAAFESAVGGALMPGVSARASLMYRRRDDWVDNRFTGQDEALGGYEDFAGRLQVLWDVTDNFSALFNVHGRTLDGTSTLFRANIFTTGSNDLNGNFDRDSVSYNQGGGNQQEYDTFGGSATLEYDFGGMTLTSITAYETADGSSRGDIDGGVAGVGPGFIPFDSDTQDSVDDLDQFTQEVRLASGEGPLNWQVGAYYFDSDLTITTVGPLGFPPSTTLNHTNESWAVFGQLGYDVTEALTVTGGLRYTDDEKELVGISAPVPFAPISLSGDHLSWDLSAVYAWSPDLNLYARVANGFRAPSIQGRDVAFFGAPSTASEETILSYEAGFKSDLLEGRARLNAAVFYYTTEDQQFSAIGGAGNLTQLVNAEEGEAYGLEVEGEWAVTENLLLTASYAYANTEIQDSNLVVAPCGSGQCTVTDSLDGNGNARVSGNPFPNAPEYTFDFTARYEHPLANGGSVFAATDWTVRGPLNFFLYEAVEFETDAQYEGGLQVGYLSPGGRYEFAVFGRNITDEENALGGIDFNNNTGFVNEPRVIGVSVKLRAS
ncbi:MAG: TonB-dependent receptor [Alphaproteobacteria bacterium]|nr:TonB-dependent receptor [Alphaproteobacteria bacterium]